MAGPCGGTWSPTAIYGDRRAQDGILCQELYVGTRVATASIRRKARKGELERKLATARTPSVVVPHPAAAEVYGLLAQRRV